MYTVVPEFFLLPCRADNVNAVTMMRKCTCAGLGLGQGQDVKVVHAGLVSDDDFASIVGGPHIAATGSRAVERGFAGTALADIPYAALPQLHQS